jgi:serine/threonine-protein kinase HipA
MARTAARRLDVWLHDQRVATLTARAGRLTLTYLDEVVERAGIGGLVLSAALPVTDDPYRDVDWWVDGVLPEGTAREVLEGRFGVRRGDAFGLLERIGRDCAGAVSFLPPDTTPVAAGSPVAVTEVELTAAIEDLPSHPLGADDDVPVSLAGLQSKLLLVRTPGGWARPTAGTPSTHLFKPDPFERHGLIVAEAFCLAVGRAAGLDVAESELVRLAGRDVLIVTRFDRSVHADGTVVRVHQEDGCQALGIDPAGMGKYQQRGSKIPSYEALAGVLVAHALDVQVELRALAAAMTFTVACANADGHARNHAFVLERNTARLAPIYDVAPTVLFARSRRCALHVGPIDRIDEVTATHLVLEAAHWGLGHRGAADVVAATLEAVHAAVDTVAASFPDLDERVPALVASRAAELIGGLSDRS